MSSVEIWYNCYLVRFVGGVTRFVSKRGFWDWFLFAVDSVIGSQGIVTEVFIPMIKLPNHFVTIDTEGFPVLLTAPLESPDDLLYAPCQELPSKSEAMRTALNLIKSDESLNGAAMNFLPFEWIVITRP